MAYQQKTNIFSSRKPDFTHKKRLDDRPMRQERKTPEANTGKELNYMQALMDSRQRVTVVMRDGERLRGHIRYLDHTCFSIGLSEVGPRFLLRKENIAYIAEE